MCKYAWLEGPPLMKGEWRSIWQVYGVVCVTWLGTQQTPAFSAAPKGILTVKPSKTLTMVLVMEQYGSVVYTALVRVQFTLVLFVCLYHINVPGQHMQAIEGQTEAC